MTDPAAAAIRAEAARKRSEAAGLLAHVASTQREMVAMGKRAQAAKFRAQRLLREAADAEEAATEAGRAPAFGAREVA